MRYLSNLLTFATFARTAGVGGMGYLMGYVMALVVVAVVAGKTFAGFVLEPAPSYMHDDVARPPLAPVVQRYQAKPPYVAPSDVVGFDAVLGIRRDGR